MNCLARVITAGLALSAASTLSAGIFTWIGGAGDNKLASAANWDAATSPTNGVSLVFNSTSALTLTNDISPIVSIGSITFNSGCGVHTITGNPIRGVTSVKNNSSVTNEIAVPVYFSGAIPTTDINSVPVNFSGGVTATKIMLSTSGGIYKLMGKYTLTATSSDSADVDCHRINSNVTALLLGSDSVLDYKGPLFFGRGNSNTTGGILYAEKGATVKCPHYVIVAGSGSAQMGFRGPGNFVVSGNIYHGRTPLFYNAGESGRGYPYIANEIVTVYCNNYRRDNTLSGGASPFTHTYNAKFIVGGDGVYIANNATFACYNNLNTFGAQEDYNFYGGGNINLNGKTLTIDTQDPDTGVGYKTALDENAGPIIQESGTLIKTGAGVFAFDRNKGTYSGNTIASNGTLAFTVSNPFGTSSVSILSNAIFRAMIEGNSVTNSVVIKKYGSLNACRSNVFDNLTLEDGAKITVSLEEDIDLTGFYATNNLTIADGAKIKVQVRGNYDGENTNPVVLTASSINIDNFELEGTYGNAALSVVETTDGYQALTITGLTVGDNEWTGAGDGANFSDPANWSLGRVPIYGENLFFNKSTGGTLVNDIDGLGWAVIKFGSSAGAYAISGYPFSRVKEVSNSSSNVQTFNNFVSFNSNYQVSAEGIIDFAGGAVASTMGSVSGTSAKTLKGNITLLSSWEDTSASTWTIPSGSTLAVPSYTASKNTLLNAEEGATVNIGSYTHINTGTPTDVHGFKGLGRFNVSNGITVERGYVFDGSNFMTVYPYSYSKISPSWTTFIKNIRLNIGRGGMSIRSWEGVGVDVYDDNVIIGAQDDYSVTQYDSGTGVHCFGVRDYGVTIDTQNPDTGFGHTITWSADIVGSKKIVKTGEGLLDMEYAGLSHTGEWVISNGVINVGVANALGSGAVTVEADGELYIEAGGTVPNAVALKAGALLVIDDATSTTRTTSPLGSISAADVGAKLKVTGLLPTDSTITNIVLATSCDAASFGNIDFDISGVENRSVFGMETIVTQRDGALIMCRRPRGMIFFLR